MQCGPVQCGFLEKTVSGKNKAHLTNWSFLIYAKKTVFAVFAMNQKVRPHKELWACTGIKEVTGDCSAQIRQGSDCLSLRSTHTAKPYQKKGNKS